MNPYQDILEYLYGLNRHGIKLGLDPILRVLKQMDNPQHRFVSLHIGGTNGKGSTARMAATILHAAGYQVGLYTSPHLVDFRERIQKNGVLIPEERVLDLAQRIRPLAESVGPLTFFELTTAMAFQYFAEEHVDVAVIEVGLGGRFDATNVLDPLGIVITNIACDHEQYLGHTLSSIAYEKAGIIKKGGTAVIGPMADSPRHVIESFAGDQKGTLYAWETDFRIASGGEEHFHFYGSHWTLTDLRCSLKGDHQRANAACALALLESAALKGLSVSDNAIRSGLSDVRWPGRLEWVSDQPRILLDGAHNAAAAQTLACYLDQSLGRKPNGKLIIVVGMMRDKNHSAFFDIISPLADMIILTEASLNRAATIQELMEALPKDGCSVKAIPSPSDAIQVAKNVMGPDDLICVTGSLILVGELRQILVRGGTFSI